MGRPKIEFSVPTDERWANETECRGYCPDVVVSFPDGARYRLTFYDPVRLAQDLKEEGFIGDPGLIVIPRVTEAQIQGTVERLIAQNYFSSLKPIERRS